jgi:hypothetical protein
VLPLRRRPSICALLLPMDHRVLAQSGATGPSLLAWLSRTRSSEPRAYERTETRPLVGFGAPMRDWAWCLSPIWSRC